MKSRTERLLREIEAGALDSQKPIGDLLRKVIALGGESQSTKIRDWATRELKGYGPDDELQSYRQLTAPLQIDLVGAQGLIQNQSVSSMDIPEFARDVITDELNLRMGIAQIQRLAENCEQGETVKLGPPGSPDVVFAMNRSGRWLMNVERLYWAVSPAALDGVVDQVRTALTVLVAEISANLPNGAAAPSPEVASNAFSVAVESKRSAVTVTSAQGGSTITAAPPEEPRKWLRTAAAVVIGLAGIVGLFFAIMEVQGWSF